SAMLTKLPSGLLGLVLASLAAAYMSTISTHLNWGASYVVNDFYKQQIKPEASEKELVNVGRVSTVILMVISALIALALTNALQLFDFILMFGAGTGLIFILRWFWWRINAWTEISAMLASGIISILLKFTSLGEFLFSDDGVFPGYLKFPFVVLLTTIIWLIVTFLTPPEANKVLFRFYRKTQPGGPGWKKILNRAKVENTEIIKSTQKWSVPNGILAMLIGCVLIYSCMFAIGYYLYGEYNKAMILTGVILVFGFLLIKIWKKIKGTVL
ncbi:MAG: Na+:solute symporter, partial [Flavobacteriaceae bacterium]|nr:Na+:solute symporter [Flavobacteriaceae bacterium]